MKVMELGRSRECLQFSKYQFRSRTNGYGWTKHASFLANAFKNTFTKANEINIYLDVTRLYTLFNSDIYINSDI
jgi:hypothetical protein